VVDRGEEESVYGTRKGRWDDVLEYYDEGVCLSLLQDINLDINSNITLEHQLFAIQNITNSAKHASTRLICITNARH